MGGGGQVGGHGLPEICGKVAQKVTGKIKVAEHSFPSFTHFMLHLGITPKW